MAISVTSGVTGVDGSFYSSGNKNVAIYYWNTGTLAFEVATVPAAGGGGSVTVTNFPALQAVTTKTALSPLAPSSYSVTATSGQAVASNGSRKGIVIINMGLVNVSLGFSNTAVVGSGITLTPNGTYVMDEYTFNTGAINAICGTTSSLAIQEYN